MCACLSECEGLFRYIGECVFWSWRCAHKYNSRASGAWRAVEGADDLSSLCADGAPDHSAVHREGNYNS